MMARNNGFIIQVLLQPFVLEYLKMGDAYPNIISFWEEAPMEKEEHFLDNWQQQA